MRSPRKVTMQPMGMPLRILKFAIDFLARVIHRLLPGNFARVRLRRVSSSFTFALASPMPMLTVTFETRGTAIYLCTRNASKAPGWLLCGTFHADALNHFFSRL